MNICLLMKKNMFYLEISFKSLKTLWVFLMLKGLSYSNYPLEDVWREFYKKEIKDFSVLWQINIALSVDYDSGYSKATEKEYQDLYKKSFWYRYNRT